MKTQKQEHVRVHSLTLKAIETMNSFNSLLLQTLMGRVETRPTYQLQPPDLLDQTIEDLILDSLNLDNSDDEADCYNNKTHLAKEESKIEKDIVKIILSKKTESLKPNSGQAVTIGENYVCVGFREEPDTKYRVWEWHGHIMLFDGENGLTLEYIYGNYFERVVGKEIVDVKEGGEGEHEVGDVGGLKELIDQGDSGSSRILHRNVTAGGSRFIQNNNIYYSLFFNICGDIAFI